MTPLDKPIVGSSYSDADISRSDMETGMKTADDPPERRDIEAGQRLSNRMLKTAVILIIIFVMYCHIADVAKPH